jgi:hypothetical protein
MSNTRVLNHLHVFVGKLDEVWPDLSNRQVDKLAAMLEHELWPIIDRRKKEQVKH